jgi:transposase
MVRGVEDGDSRRCVAGQFEVAASTMVRLMARYAATGSVEPMKQGRPAGSGKLGPHKAYLIERVQAKPDITMKELAARLKEERGVEAHATCIGKLLRAAGFTYKKNPAGVGAGAQRREGRAH